MKAQEFEITLGHRPMFRTGWVRINRNKIVAYDLPRRWTFEKETAENS